jgi:hypothetical protein
MISSPSDSDSPTTMGDLLSESVDAADLRKNAVFERLRVQANGNIVLFWGGRLGCKAAAALCRHGVHPLIFADNDERLNGTDIEGIPVVLPSAAADCWCDGSLFAFAAFLPSGGGVRSRLQELEALGCQWATNFLHLAWRYDGILLHFGADLLPQ